MAQVVYHFGDNKEIDKIILDTHNEFSSHSANWGKGKEIKAVCERTGFNKKTVKHVLLEMEHPYGRFYLTEKEKEQRTLNKEQRVQRREAFFDWCERVTAKNSVVHCPKCHSTSISYQSKVSVGRAAVGGAIAGPTGAILGGLTGKKGYAVCLKCGKRWKI